MSIIPYGKHYIDKEDIEQVIDFLDIDYYASPEVLAITPTGGTGVVIPGRPLATGKSVSVEGRRTVVR